MTDSIHVRAARGAEKRVTLNMLHAFRVAAERSETATLLSRGELLDVLSLAIDRYEARSRPASPESAASDREAPIGVEVLGWYRDRVYRMRRHESGWESLDNNGSPKWWEACAPEKWCLVPNWHDARKGTT